MTQPTLFRTEPPFDGDTFEPAQDQARLTGQLARVRWAMKDGQWRSLRQLATSLNASEASISARLRDLRKPKFGGYTVERKRISGGLFHYRMTR